MFYYKSIIQYEGTNYCGFQFQKNLKTIQFEINRKLEKLTNAKISTVASSRTDTGVHAYMQILKITSDKEFSNKNFIDQINSLLPKDISFISLEACTASFKPTTIAKRKEYRYLFTNNKIVSPLDTLFMANISKPLDIDLVERSLNLLIGTHDFCNFYSAGSNVKSTIREIYQCDISIINPHTLFADTRLFKITNNINQCYQIRIEANGFLKQMIRHIVSAVWMVGTGKMSLEEFAQLIDGEKSKKQKWKVSSPNGLFLYNISQ